VEIARVDELQLVQRCKDGSEAAFAELVRRYRPRLFTLAYRLTSNREAAEDVVQDTFVAAFRTIHRFEPRPSLAAWLNTIAIRAAAKVAEKGSHQPRASLDLLMSQDDGVGAFQDATIDASSDPHEAAERAELRREMADAIAALPFKYRAAVVTRYILGLDYAEAAASLEMGLNTYKSQLLRGTRMLREALAGALGRDVPDEQLAPQPALAVAHARVTTSAPMRGVAAYAAPPLQPRPFSEGRRTRLVEAVAKERAARG